MAQRRGAARSRPVILWFRTDLRLSDHPALAAAVETGRPVLPVYLLDETSPGLRPLGGASKWWLAGSLASLAAELAARGARLRVLAGPAATAIPRLTQASSAELVVWSRRYEPAERAVDDAVEAELGRLGVEVRGFNGTLWHEPDDIRPKTGDWYRIYTPYWRAAAAAPPAGDPLPAPERVRGAEIDDATLGAVPLESLGLLPRHPDWSGGLVETWTPGEPAALAKLHRFVAEALDRYPEDRNTPALAGSSQLSPHLRFGEVSPQQVIRAAGVAAAARRSAAKAEKYVQEIVWRDFAYSLLAHVPHLADQAYSRRFEHFTYARPGPQVTAWQRGRTGYPIVDAGMRQLWRTGWMHNRVRMVTASFLCKHLLVDWRVGEAWFWDTLCDADPANNAVNWQWVAGTGPDAAPFFRIFNPVTQGEKFDPDGHYVRRFVPELARLPPRFVHRPWEAPASVLEEAGVALGRTYPEPIVEHAVARQAALRAFEASRLYDA